jgi:hypothetical protein
MLNSGLGNKIGRRYCDCEELGDCFSEAFEKRISYTIVGGLHDFGTVLIKVDAWMKSRPSIRCDIGWNKKERRMAE